MLQGLTDCIQSIISLIFIAMLLLFFTQYEKRNVSNVKALLEKEKKRADAAENAIHKHFVDFAYQPKAFFMSANEQGFYEALSKQLPDKYLIFPQVRVADVVEVNPEIQKKISARSIIAQKHFDFVIVSKQFLTPILVIELTDSTHEQPDRRARDLLLNELLTSESMESSNFGGLCFVKADDTSSSLPANVFTYTQAVNTVLAELQKRPIRPKCAYCHADMIKIKSEKNDQYFWGCPNWKNWKNRKKSHSTTNKSNPHKAVPFNRFN